VWASCDDSHFLPFNRDPSHDSGTGARQENYYFRRLIASPFPGEKLEIVAFYLLFASRNLPYCLSGEFFLSSENTLGPKAVFLLKVALRSEY
jgi:hypothetical protein